jgi:hypothetical protein
MKGFLYRIGDAVQQLGIVIPSAFIRRAAYHLKDMAVK